MGLLISVRGVQLAFLYFYIQETKYETQSARSAGIIPRFQRQLLSELAAILKKLNS